MKGVFYGVGVGPGDPELITLKGYRVLREADVICSPKTNPEDDQEGIALSIIRGIIGEKQEIRELYFPMTKNQLELERCREEAAGQIIAFLNKGKKVAFVTLGDPTLYSTYTYLLKIIKQAGPYAGETIPGVPSFCAGAALANLALAESEEKLAVIPVVKDLSTLRGVLQTFENVVLMKAGRKFKEIVKVLEELNLEDKTVFVSRCGLPGGFVAHSLEEAKEKEKDYLSLFIIKNNL